jgi:hypothetical protein
MPPCSLLLASSLLLLPQLPAAAAAAAAGAGAGLSLTCDIAIAGGSLSSIAAALSAAAALRHSSQRVCLFDITDWPGGQLTASGTSAVDWGSVWRNFPANMAPNLAALMTSPGLGGSAAVNPGACSVSSKCFLPLAAVQWLQAELAKLAPSLSYFPSSALTAVARDAGSGRLSGLTFVQRTATAEHPGGWDRNLSAGALEDWYSAEPSAFFSKQLLQVSLPAAGVVIEATEFGDVLLLSGAEVAQGMEVPTEGTHSYEEGCGQAATTCFWLSWGSVSSSAPDATPAGSAAGYAMAHPSRAEDLDHALTWRRSLSSNLSDVLPLQPRSGDVFLINEQAGNDLLSAQLLLPLAAVRAQVAAGTYAGGLNSTVLQLLEQRAFNYYWALKNATAALYPGMGVSLNASAAGTGHGLAKLPYLRESRRALAGIQGFRLCSAFAAVNGTGPGAGCWNASLGQAELLQLQAQQAASAGRTGFKFVDSIALGSYGFDQHRLNRDVCSYPAYLNYTEDPFPAVPYYVPFRALTVRGVPNLLVSGKSMAQTYLANAVTRLHPTEWSTGTAAGAAAALMLNNSFSSEDMYVHRQLLFQLLDSAAIRQPREWSL